MDLVKFFLRCWLPAALASSGCGEPPDRTVAEVGEYLIKGSSLRALVADLLPGQKTDATGDEARRHYLQILVDGRLLLLEARNLGIDTTLAVEKAVDLAVDEWVRALYRKSVAGSGAEVTEADVRQVFEREGFDVERRLSRILAPGRAGIDEVAEALKAGQSFDEVAERRSGAGDPARRGGTLGYVGRPALTRLRIPADLFRTLADGEVSRPLAVAGGSWQVIRFTETVPVAFSKYAPLIERQLRRKRRIQALSEHREALAHSYRVRLNPAGLRELMEAYRRRRSDPLAASSTPLYHHDKGVITVAEADEALAAAGLRRSFADSAQAEQVVRSYVLSPRLFELAAAAAGLYDTPDIRRFRRQQRDQAVAEAVRSTAVAGIEVSEEEVRGYYGDNPGIFRIEGYTAVEELLLGSEAAAREIRDRIAAGERFVDLAGHSLRPDARKLGARYHFHRQEGQIYPRLTAATALAREGELTGPVAVAGGYSIFRVLERVPESMYPYERASHRARTLLLGRRQAEALEGLLRKLGEKYASQVVVHSRELTEALPDSLLRK